MKQKSRWHWRAAAVGAFAIVCCGCSSPARSPTFDPMPVDQNNLSAVFGPVTGTGPRTFTVAASRSMSLTVGCIGKGSLVVLGPLSAGEVLCSSASLGRGAFAGYYWSHLRARPGEHLRLRIVTNPKTIWDIRVDGLPRHCKDHVCANCQLSVCESLP
jgi:hypothetical protein